MAIHPGEILGEEFLRPYDLAPSRLVERLGLPANRITAIVNGERGITAETAVLLGEAFGTTAEFWTSLQARYDLDCNRDMISPERISRARELHRELTAAA